MRKLQITYTYIYIHIYVHYYISHLLYRVHILCSRYSKTFIVPFTAEKLQMHEYESRAYIVKREVKSRVDRIARIKFWSNFILDTSHTRFPSTARTMELRNTVQGWTEVSNMPRAPLLCATVIRYSLLYRTQWAHE